MSVTDRPSRPELKELSPASPLQRFATWARVLLICTLLVGSGLIRLWQDRQVQHGLRMGRAMVVPLASVPMQFGAWFGVDTKLDPQIARVTAADLIVTRRYTNRNTGVVVDVIMLFGPSFGVSLHAPTVCYPAAGFKEIEAPAEKVVEVDRASSSATLPVPALSAVYGKGEGTHVDRQEVYWTWWYDGHWTPYAQNTKHLERVPSIIKVQTARRLIRGERRDVNNPSEAFLRDLISEIERLLPSSSPSST